MIQYDQYAELSQNAFDRLDEILEYSPQSIPVRIQRFNYHPAYIAANPQQGVEGDPYGYERPGNRNQPLNPDVTYETSRAIIVFTPERRFLKKIGIFWDESKGDTLPIVGFFKDSLNLQREDMVLIDVHDTGGLRKDDIINRRLKIVDILTKGNTYQFRKAYHLAPYRSK